MDLEIVKMMKENTKISAEKLAAALGVTTRTIRRHIKMLNNVHYVGRCFSGHWEVDER